MTKPTSKYCYTYILNPVGRNSVKTTNYTNFKHKVPTGRGHWFTVKLSYTSSAMALCHVDIRTRQNHSNCVKFLLTLIFRLSVQDFNPSFTSYCKISLKIKIFNKAFINLVLRKFISLQIRHYIHASLPKGLSQMLKNKAFIASLSNSDLNGTT